MITWKKALVSSMLFVMPNRFFQNYILKHLFFEFHIFAVLHYIIENINKNFLIEILIIYHLMRLWNCFTDTTPEFHKVIEPFITQRILNSGKILKN